jgi:hypothetical protein
MGASLGCGDFLLSMDGPWGLFGGSLDALGHCGRWSGGGFIHFRIWGAALPDLESKAAKGGAV